ncbi:methyltransferase domain-containing protein [Planktothrix agardhii]|uniref:hypothetical protein n=1 Tax=Planktothrix agardhii TaxID=1160 RepID=UPI001D0AB053|nr:hypothetical protein [Planktothrix agardhii]MCB8752750.1 hypothetical protein [Planktothrix agardhii 1810]MCF3609567.1 hypothetical protein [Planktothrix agardhii 1033]
MKILSGNFLSQILDIFKRANKQQLDQSEIIAELIKIVEHQSIQLELEDKFINSSSTIDNSIIQKQRQLDAESLDTLNCLLPWSSYNKLSNSTIIGGAYTSLKRSAPHQIPDKHINVLQEYCNLNDDCSAIEFGCFEGHYTASLATICKKVYGLDSRIENVIKTLVRCWFLGLEDKVSVDLINLETDSLVNFYQTRYKLDTIDIAHHRGVLYHLADPVAHLIDVSNLCNKYLYLHTQYATPEQAVSDYESPLGKYLVFMYKEEAINYSPFAGMVSQAIWLQKSDLFSILKQLGFTQIKEISDTQERNGCRIELIAAKTGAELR